MWQFLKVHVHCGACFWTNENYWHFIKVTSLDLLLTSEKAPSKRFGLSVVSSPRKSSWISPVTRIFRNTAFLHCEVLSVIFPEQETPLQIELGSILYVKHSPKKGQRNSLDMEHVTMTWPRPFQMISENLQLSDKSPQLRQVSTWKLFTFSIISQHFGGDPPQALVGWSWQFSNDFRYQLKVPTRTVPSAYHCETFGNCLVVPSAMVIRILPWISCRS